MYSDCSFSNSKHLSISSCVEQTTTGTIYLISCKTCGEKYIGETGRPLWVRIKEHLAGKSKLNDVTPLGSHRKHIHGFKDFEVEVTILAQEHKTSARKILEAFWIHTHCPKMNRKEECLVITRDLEPYLRSAFADPNMSHSCETRAAGL